jgi:hypothetical protein
MSTKPYIGGFTQLADGVGVSGKVLTLKTDDTLVWATPSAYTLPTASPTVLGGVKVGSGLAIDGSGILSTSTAWDIEGTTTDAAGDKISDIQRYGTVTATSFNTQKDLVKTNITGHNKWYKVFVYAIGSPIYQGESFKVQMNEASNQTILTLGKSVIFDIFTHGNGTTTSINVNIDSGITAFDLVNFEVLYEASTKKLSFYYRPTLATAFSNWLVLNASLRSTTVLTFTDLLIGTDLLGEPNDTITYKSISLNKVNGAYTLPTAAPIIGQVLGYSAPGITGWTPLVTPFHLSANSSIDALGDKTSPISRSGSINCGNSTENVSLHPLAGIEHVTNSYSQVITTSYSDTAYPIFRQTRKRGTRSVFAPAVAGDILGYYGFASANDGASIMVKATETHSLDGAVRGSEMIFSNCANGQATQIENLRIQQDGKVKVSNAYTLPTIVPTTGQVLGYSSLGDTTWSKVTSTHTTGATGSFTSNDGKTITVTNGLITSII